MPLNFVKVDGRYELARFSGIANVSYRAVAPSAKLVLRIFGDLTPKK
jgi:hypothetical protein